MSIVKVRDRGQLTIPSEFRKDLGLEQDDAMNIVKVGETLMLTRKRLIGDAVSKTFEKAMTEKGIGLDELLGEIKKQRSKYVKETYEKKKI